jgi:Fic family protein
MTESKTTYLSAVRYAVEHGDFPAEIANKLNALAESLEKRANAIRKPTKKQIESAEARDGIPAVMEQGKLYSATEIGKLFGQSSQWASPKLNALVNAGVLVKTVDKRKTYFSLA